MGQWDRKYSTKNQELNQRLAQEQHWFRITLTLSIKSSMYLLTYQMLLMEKNILLFSILFIKK